MWIGTVVVSAIASVAGYVLFQDSSPDTTASVLAYTARTILTILADTMMPEPFEHRGPADRRGHRPRLRHGLRHPCPQPRRLSGWQGARRGWSRVVRFVASRCGRKRRLSDLVMPCRAIVLQGLVTQGHVPETA